MTIRSLLCALFGRWLGRYCEAESCRLVAQEPALQLDLLDRLVDLINCSEEERTMQMRTDQFVDVRFIARRADGSEARVDGVPHWDITNPEGSPVTVTVAEDGLSARVAPVSLDSFGTTTEIGFLVTADADLDEGEVRSISSALTLEVELLEAEALYGELVVGQPGSNDTLLAAPAEESGSESPEA